MFSTQVAFAWGSCTSSHTLSLELDSKKNLRISPNASSSHSEGDLHEYVSFAMNSVFLKRALFALITEMKGFCPIFWS